MTTTSLDERALLAAICAHPDEDTPRLVYADWVDENGDPARAEFIRAQCELAACPLCPDWCDNDPEKCRVAWLERRVKQLLTAHEADWRRGPVCGKCGGAGSYLPPGRAYGGPTSPFERCLHCGGTGDAGGLLAHVRLPRVDMNQENVLYGPRPVEFRRGFPDVVRCELGECVEEKRETCMACFGTRRVAASEGDRRVCCPICHGRGDMGLKWRVTDWARRVVRYHPVRGFRVTDREPQDYGRRAAEIRYGWTRTVEAEAVSDIPDAVLALMPDFGAASTSEAAHDALAVALALLARKANTTLEEART